MSGYNPFSTLESFLYLCLAAYFIGLVSSAKIIIINDLLAKYAAFFVSIYLKIRSFYWCETLAVYTMEKGSSVKFFEDKKIRSAWNEEEEEWYFSVVDVIEGLTDSANPTDYLKKLR